MNGAGNDFVMVHDPDRTVRLDTAAIRHACDRRRGVGADGLILVQSARGFDFHMSYYNADGLPAEMCGNGSRCSASFAASLGLGRREGQRVRLRFSTDSGPIGAVVEGNHVKMDMMDARDMRRGVSVQVARGPEIVHFIVVGTRHAVVPVDDVRSLTDNDINGLGRMVRRDDAFAPVGANVNFVSVDDRHTIRLRTYEKGVEAETLACGTGSVAAAVLLAHLGRLDCPVNVIQWSGDKLVVSFALDEGGANNVTLGGPVAVNFTGSLEL
jgi:diaminopimelate epimerase